MRARTPAAASGQQSQHVSSTTTTNNNDSSHRPRSAHQNPYTSNIISSVRRFLNFHLHQPRHHNRHNQYHAQQPQQQSHQQHHGSPKSHSSPIGIDDVKLPLFKLCNFGVWRDAELGRGYSGVVHRGIGILLNDEENDVKDSRPMALKLSKPRTTHFNHEAFGTPGREFETLKFLHLNGVPVPRPFGFCMSADDSGSSRTLLLMELVDGLTLREWINNQTELVLRHVATGRTLHPAKSIGAAIERLDVVIGLIEALQKLHQFGVFVDLKPRNIMVGRHKVWVEGTGENVRYDGESNVASPRKTYSRFAYPVTLVDLGGVVLRRNIQQSRSRASETKIDSMQHPRLSNHSTLDTRRVLVNNDGETKENKRDDLDQLEDWHADHHLNGIQYGDSLLHSCIHSTRRQSTGFESEQRAMKGMKHSPIDESRLKELVFEPLKHRQLLETTCSYLSPELAAIIVECDRNNQLLINHFHPSLRERLKFHDSEMKGKAAAMTEAKTRLHCCTYGQTDERTTDQESNKQNGFRDGLFDFNNQAMDRDSSCEYDDDGDIVNENQHSWLTKTFIRCRQQLAATIHRDKKQLNGKHKQKNIISTSRSRLKMMVLLKNYEKSLEEMKRQNIVTSMNESEDPSVVVLLGQKSSVFSLGLIFVELFGGLRTGLTGLCHFPVITNWFSKDYAYDLIAAEYNRKVELRQQPQQHPGEIKKDSLSFTGGRFSSTQCEKLVNRENDERNLSLQSRDDKESLPSLTPYSGPSNRAIDCEFRIILGWESELIPCSVPSSSTQLFNLEALRGIHWKRRPGDVENNDGNATIEEPVNENPRECVSANYTNRAFTLNDWNNNDHNKKRKSINEPTPSTAAPNSSQTDNSADDQSHKKKHGNGKWKKGNERADNKKGKGNKFADSTTTMTMKSFKELYKEYCYPFEGCLSTNWVFNCYENCENNDENSQKREGRFLELPVGRLTEQILDKCLEYNPVRRPTYATLKRMIHGLKLILWNLKNDCIIDKWRGGKCRNVKNIDIQIDDLGYIEMSGLVYDDSRSNNTRKTTILRTTSKLASCTTYPDLEVEDRFELSLDIHFD